MGYKGSTFLIDCSKGGFNHNHNADMMPQEAMVHPSRNINLNRNGREKRGGTAHVNSSILTSEVIANGTCDADTDWDVGAEWVFDTDHYNFSYVGGGGSDRYLTQSGLLVDGRSYTVTYTLSNMTPATSQVRFKCGEGTSGELRTTDGTYTETLTADITGGNIVGFKCFAGTGSIDTVSVNMITQTMGLHDFTLGGGSLQYIVVVGRDGKVYKNYNTTIKTGWTTGEYYADFEVYEDELYIVNGYNIPGKWDGTTWTDLDTDVPTEWETTNQPSWIVKHGRGASERMFAGGVASCPQRVFISPHGDGDDFSVGNVLTIDINTGDGFGIIGAIEHGDRLILFGKRRVFILDDESTDTGDWGYQEAQWIGGASNFRLICKTPNDVVAMTDDGDVYSVLAAEAYGDYKQASLARPAFINEWMKEYLDLTKINRFHMLYDQSLRAIKIFCVKKGETNVGLALCYFIDRQPIEAWMPHENRTFDSGYDASASALVRQSAGNYEIYTGDYSGYLWRLEQGDEDDNNNSYYGGFFTPKMDLLEKRIHKKFKRAWVSTESANVYDLNINWWVDGTQQTQRTIALSGTGGTVLGSFVLGTDTLGGVSSSEDPVDLGNIGKKIQFEVYSNNVNEDFFISQLLIDYKQLGKRPS